MQSELQELHVLKLGIFIFEPKTDNPESFSLVTMQTKVVKDCPDPNLLAAAPIDARAPYAVIEKTRNQDTARRAEIIRSAKSRSVQIRRHFIKNMPGWLRSSSNLRILQWKTYFLSRDGSHPFTIALKQMTLW